MKTTYYFILLILLAFNNKDLYGQEQEAILAFPTSAELGRFGRTPVGLFTGTVQESVPLYELKTRNLTYPISLNYSSNGLKVNKVSSRYGFDWTMPAEGVIIREIRGMPDDVIQFTPYPVNLDPTDPITYEEYEAELSYFRGWRFYGTDSEPDIFSFNFCGYTGQFYNESPCCGNIVLVPYQNLEVGTIYRDSIRITDEKGIQYLFRKGELSTFDADGFGFLTVSAYRLSKIVHPAGDVINFNYHVFTGSLIYRTSISDNECHVTLNGSEDGCRTSYMPVLSSPVLNLSKINGYYTYLNSIDAPGYGEIVFHYSDDRPDFMEPRMTGFTVHNENDETIRSVCLYHQFPSTMNFNNSVAFERESGDDVRYRMFLDSVVIKDINGKGVEKYAFEYNNLNQLPIRLSYSQDHWGYFNGAANFSLLPDQIPAYIKQSYFPDLDSTRTIANREANYLYARKGMLSKIIFPTGGYTEFEYEAHCAQNFPSAEHGGVRLKQQRSYTEAGQLAHVNTYEYSGGLAHWTLSNIEYFDIKHVSKGNSCFIPYESGNDCPCTYYGVSSFSVYWLKSDTFFPLGLSGNYDIGYQKVTIYDGESLVSNNGKEEHYFQVESDTYEHSPIYGDDVVLPPPVCNTGWKSGTKTKETYYIKEGGTFIPVKEIQYQYKEDEANSITNYYPAIQCTAFDYPPNIPINYGGIDSHFNVSLYWIISKWRYLSAKIEKNYDSSGALMLTDTIRYYYDNPTHALQTRIVKTTSDGESITSKTRYPSDVNAGVYSEMANRHMYNYPIEQITLRNNQFAGSQLTTYKSVLGHYVQDKIYTLETNSPFSSFTYFNGTTKDNHYNSTPDISFDAYNSKGNLRQSTERNGMVTSYLWDSTGNYPMAKAVNATYSQISSQDGKVVTFNSKTLNNSLRSLVPGAQVQTFSYKPLLGMTSQTDLNGIVINYEYDTFGRLKLQKNDDTHIVNRYKYHYKQ